MDEKIKNYFSVLGDSKDISSSQKSLTNVLYTLSKVSPEYLIDFSDENFRDDFETLIHLEIGEIGDYLNLTIHTERPKILEMLSKIDLAKATLMKPAFLIQKINEILRQNQFQSRIDAKYTPEFLNIIKRLKFFKNGLDNFNLVSVYQPSIDTLPYAKRYIDMDTDKIQDELNLLQKVRYREREIYQDYEKLNDLLVETLSKVGHTTISLSSMTNEEMINVLFLHTIAAKAIFDIKKSSNRPISKEDALDSIARIYIEYQNANDKLNF
jgi:hypothetical protein